MAKGHVNRRPGPCFACGGTVPENGGVMYPTGHGRKWRVYHLACDRSGGAQVDTFGIGGKEYIRNKKGLCEDAPCCGCCTI